MVCFDEKFLKLLAVNFITVCARPVNSLERLGGYPLFNDRVTLIHVCSNLMLPVIYLMYY